MNAKIEDMHVSAIAQASREVVDRREALRMADFKLAEAKARRKRVAAELDAAVQDLEWVMRYGGPRDWAGSRASESGS